MQKKIYYHDTDCGGVVYYANYLKYLEEARTELLSTIGLSIPALAKRGILFVVSRQEIDYKSTAGYGDILTIDTWISEISQARLTYEARIDNQDGKLIAIAKTLLACVDNQIKPQAIPEDIRKAHEKLKRAVK